MKEKILILCQLCNIKPEQFYSKSRRYNLPHFRYIFCYCVRENCNSLTLETIGGFIGMHHATVLHGIKKIKDLINPPVSDLYISNIVKQFNIIIKMDIQKRIIVQLNEAGIKEVFDSDRWNPQIEVIVTVDNRYFTIDRTRRDGLLVELNKEHFNEDF